MDVWIGRLTPPESRVRTVASSVTTYRYENGRRYHAYREF